MKQTDRLLEYMRSHVGITPLEALNELSIFRLAARISDLRSAGHRIQTIRKRVTNKQGEECFVAEYRLEAEHE